MSRLNEAEYIVNKLTGFTITLYFFWQTGAILTHTVVRVSPQVTKGLYGERQPSKHRALSHCWVDVEPASQTLGQHQTNIGSTPCSQQI